MPEDKKPRILVTGSAGQLGMSFQKIAGKFPDMEFIFPTKYDFDITVRSRETKALLSSEVDAVINCAGYTNVEKAELEPDEARLVNATATGYLADACHEAGCLLVHFSTDYVFDGQNKLPYTEEDKPNPLSSYGRSKLEGEQILDQITKRHFIIRTSWLYSEFGHNFFKTMLRLAAERGELKVVNDQVSSPTYAGHLATHVLQLVQKVIVRKEHVDYGLYHYSENGEASWWHFAQEIMSVAGMNVPVLETSSLSLYMRAVRPAYSKLQNTKFQKNTGAKLYTWQEGLRECYANYQKILSDESK